MSKPIITVENLGKSYLVGHQSAQQENYTALRDVIGRTVKDFGRKAWDMARGRQIIQGDEVEEFWALKDVNFEVNQGEVVGIIGRNGAGKSTLLKVLSRITEPTKGKVTLRGRVASLLEVGTGFHPELSGRENIFLNGAILGMTRGEINKKFDEIVDFAGVEKFLDTPVKRYSSGMYVRLAFAVAAHLEPEILVVDEVLAVGDVDFQKKCLGKMKDVAAGGRTVLFVSHNMGAIQSLCEKCLILESGTLCNIHGDTKASINYYNTGNLNSKQPSNWTNSGAELTHTVSIPQYFRVADETGRGIDAPVPNDQQITVIIGVKILQLDPALNFGFSVYNQNDQEILWSLTTDREQEMWPRLELGINELRCELPTRFLNEGRYRLEMIASLHQRDWFVRPTHNSPSIYFDIKGGLSKSPYWLSRRPGVLAPILDWELIHEFSSK